MGSRSFEEKRAKGTKSEEVDAWMRREGQTASGCDGVFYVHERARPRGPCTTSSESEAQVVSRPKDGASI